MKKVAIVFYAIILLGIHANAAENTGNGQLLLAETNTSDTADYSSPKSVRMAPFPVIAYQDATSLMLGAMLFVLFDDTQNEDAETDRLAFIGIYTLKKQIQAKAQYEKYLLNYRIMNKGQFEYVYFPTEFYGLGTKNSEKRKEEFNSKHYGVEESLLFRVTDRRPKIWIGPAYLFRNVKYSDIEDGGMLDRGVVSGIDGTIVSAPGLEFIYDTRDNGMWSTRGSYFEATMDYNSEMLGATQECAGVTVDYRHFWDLADFLDSLDKKSYIFGIRAFGKAQGGDVPLTLMSELGGDVILRGYGTGYQEKCKYASEIEFRYPIWKSFSGTVFGGFGDVAADPLDFHYSDVHFAGGLGFRYALIDGDDKLNLRLDLAYNREGSPYVCFDVMEAF